ncbi:hypothetical protein PENTCL1PPCAC_21293 [Pristionchus entomophagus]|uniref:RRM domain-containing protein n=1 Tax=Pristionchus entomophagus TaxID=358040 RepID=A0AAV5TX43_9BILA|nr:hypothetical protein PENTCL1PPCAC_21292 [Pristionchus entomophagus]GMS99118.1 hypothetical protein PENTCL1PPCAC_21293 [Pristionchus entomophagus]
MPLDRLNKKPRGIAFVEFADLEGRENALAMNQSQLKGRTIKVAEKRTNQPGFTPGFTNSDLTKVCLLSYSIVHVDQFLPPPAFLTELCQKVQTLKF